MTYEEWQKDESDLPYPHTPEKLYQWCLHYYNKGALDALNQLKFEVEGE